MGKDTIYLFEGNGEWDVEAHLIELLGLDLEEYYENPAILTKDVINKSLINIIKELRLHSQDLSIDISKACYLHYLGYFILKTGADLPDNLRSRIVESTTPEKDGYKWETKELEEQRKILLKDLRDKILSYSNGNNFHLIEDGGKPLHTPAILIEWDKLKILIEKGCSLRRIAELLDREYNTNITTQIIIENIEYNEPLTAIFNQTFKNAQKKILRPIIRQYFIEGTKSPEDLRKNFISSENPEGIPIHELKQLVKDIFKVKSWEYAIAIARFSFKKEKEVYLRLWHNIKSYLENHKDYFNNEKIVILKQIINEKWITDSSYKKDFIELRAQTPDLPLIEQLYKDLNVIYSRGSFFGIKNNDLDIIDQLIKDFQLKDLN